MFFDSSDEDTLNKRMGDHFTRVQLPNNLGQGVLEKALLMLNMKNQKHRTLEQLQALVKRRCSELQALLEKEKEEESQSKSTSSRTSSSTTSSSSSSSSE